MCVCVDVRYPDIMPRPRLFLRISSLLGLSSFFLLFFVLCIFPCRCLAKKLVLFAGPHKAASVSVELFFYNHASEYEDTTPAEGLAGWKWPKLTQNLWIDPDHMMPMSDVLNALVTQANNITAQLILRQAIQTAWESAEHGIIVGTAEFDRVATTPYTHFDGLGAMKGVVQQLQVPPEDVTVILNYRTPRRDQWISMWKHAEGDDHYKKFMCKSDSRELEEVLDTAMNPLKLAVAYRKEGWNVVLIDMSGVNAKEKDVSHVIACDILEHTVCQNGLVIPILHSYTANYGGDKNLNSLEGRDQNEMDQLFRERDCYYEPALSNDRGFKILYRDTIWQGCLKTDRDGQKTQEQLYQPLVDPGFILGALKEQKSCSMGGPKMKNILVGDYESMLVSTISNANEHGEAGTIYNENANGQEEEFNTEDRQESNNSIIAQRSSWWILVLLVSTLGCGVYKLCIRRRNRQDFDHYPVQELTSVKGIPASDLLDRAKRATQPAHSAYWSDAPRSSYSDGDMI